MTEELSEVAQVAFEALSRAVYWIDREELRQAVVRWANAVNLPNLNAINYCMERVLWGHELPFKIKQVHGGVGIEL